jgi:endogenous inhibitor of DNA gyrase (YacG/DUF329 family)
MTPNDGSASPRAAACRICGKPATQQHRPFCSARCRDIDLGRWLKDSYRIETEEGPDDSPDETG